MDINTILILITWVVVIPTLVFAILNFFRIRDIHDLLKEDEVPTAPAPAPAAGAAPVTGN